MTLEGNAQRRSGLRKEKNLQLQKGGGGASKGKGQMGATTSLISMKRPQRTEKSKKKHTGSHLNGRSGRLWVMKW